MPGLSPRAFGSGERDVELLFGDDAGDSVEVRSDESLPADRVEADVFSAQEVDGGMAGAGMGIVVMARSAGGLMVIILVAVLVSSIVGLRMRQPGLMRMAVLLEFMQGKGVPPAKGDQDHQDSENQGPRSHHEVNSRVFRGEVQAADGGTPVVSL